MVEGVEGGYNTYNVDIYVVANSGNVLGYWDTNANAANNAQFQFYAVDDMYDAADCGFVQL